VGLGIKVKMIDFFLPIVGARPGGSKFRGVRCVSQTRISYGNYPAGFYIHSTSLGIVHGSN